MTHALFEIYQSTGQSTGGGISRGPRFRHLRDALAYVEEHRGDASFAIKRPDGRWVIGDDGRRAIFKRTTRR